MLLDVQDEETVRHFTHYTALLALPIERLRVTTARATFEAWLGRRVSGGIGGAYVYLAGRNEHAIFINLGKIDRRQERAIEIVVAEELIHMQDHLAGDRRRHAKHGYDRIAHRVAEVTGATLDEIRTCLIPRRVRPYRYLYACPTCGGQVPRRVKGTWSCRRCSGQFRRRHQLRLIGILEPGDSRSVLVGEPPAQSQ